MTMQPDNSDVTALAQAIASLSAEIAALRQLAQSGDLGDDGAIKEVRLAKPPRAIGLDRHQYAPALSILKL